MSFRGVYRSPSTQSKSFYSSPSLLYTEHNSLRYPNHAALPSCQSLQYRFPPDPLPHVLPQHPDKSSLSHPDYSAIQNQLLYLPMLIAVPVRKRHHYFQKCFKTLLTIHCKVIQFLESFRKFPSLLPVRHSDKAACPHLYTDSIHVAKHWHYGTAV